MPNFIFPEGDRTRAINADNILCAESVHGALEIRYCGGEIEAFHGDQAREMWISLGLAEVVTDGDGNKLKLCTPFGERQVL